MWVEIKGYEGIYKMNDSGLIINVTSGTSKQIFFNPQGYKMVTLCKGNKSKTFLLHRLIAQHFIPNPKNYRCVNHIDGDKKNNSLINLEWCNHAHNNKHAYSIGLKKPYNRSVVQFDANMNEVRRFVSLSEAGKVYNLSCISRCLSKTHLKHSGFYWRYA